MAAQQKYNDLNIIPLEEEKGEGEEPVIVTKDAASDTRAGDTLFEPTSSDDPTSLQAQLASLKRYSMGLSPKVQDPYHYVMCNS